MRSTLSVNYDIRPTVEKYTKLPFERLRLVQNITDLRLSEIRAGVAFIFAGWSGPSVVALGGFTHFLSKINLGSLDIIIIDNDCMNDGDDAIRLFGHVFRGAGEMLWIREGHVVAEISFFSKELEEQILSNTRNLLG